MGDKREYGYSPDYSVAPGETLLETIQALGIYQAELAARTGRTGDPRPYQADMKDEYTLDFLDWR